MDNIINDENVPEKLSRLKKITNGVGDHFKKHKMKYIIGASCLVSGLLIGYLIHKRPIINITQRDKGTNIIGNNNITTILIRRGHPGYIVKCLETGEIFASQNRASEMMNINITALRRHLNGEHPDAKGFHFERLGEAR